KLFVSYTLRDGIVTRELLLRLNTHLLGVCTPFIHALEEKNLASQQLGVLLALVSSHAVLLLLSPGLQKSPWVRLELWLARLLLLPVITLEARELTAWKEGTT